MLLTFCFVILINLNDVQCEHEGLLETVEKGIRSGASGPGGIGILMSFMWFIIKKG